MLNSIRSRMTFAFLGLAVGPLMIMAVPIIALDTGKTDGVLMADVR